MSHKMVVFPEEKLSFKQKFFHINKTLLSLAFCGVLIGTIMLYASAQGSLYPWAGAHFSRYLMAMGLCLGIAFAPIGVIYKPAYLFHIIAILLLVATDIFGEVSKGAVRWLNLGFITFQPSELAKTTTLVALARFFHDAYRWRLPSVYMIIVPVLIIFLPTFLVLIQPDLGTALLLVFAGVTVMFASGLNWRLFVGSGVICLASLPIIWMGLRSYQKNRVLTFLNPESDPLGTGYHIAQAKIAMGSGGITGRGFMKGTQSMLEFLPEKHTDFAFTAFAEQFGCIGSVLLLALYIMITFTLVIMALRARHIFGKMLILGIGTNFFFYVFINMAMVMGLLPVVGIPLPFISYGGTVMLTVFIGFGIALNAHINEDPITSEGLT